jgi:hypothetical protein
MEEIIMKKLGYVLSIIVVLFIGFGFGVGVQREYLVKYDDRYVSAESYNELYDTCEDLAKDSQYYYDLYNSMIGEYTEAQDTYEAELEKANQSDIKKWYNNLKDKCFGDNEIVVTHDVKVK